MMSHTADRSAPHRLTIRSKRNGLLYSMLGIGILWLLPNIALASSDVPTETILCYLVSLLQGATGKAIATVALSSLGIMALFGKLDKTLAAIIALGIALMFGAASFAPAIGGGSAGCSSGSSLPAAPFSCSNGVATGNLFTLADNTTYTNFNTAINYTGSGSSSSSSSSSTSGGACDAVTGIFGQVMCVFKATVGQIMSTMYCSFQHALLGPLSIALTIFIIVFGILIMTGMVDFTVAEAGKALFKIALVWAFAANADWGIGIAYRFFMGAAEEGSNIVLNAINPGASVSFNQLDATLANTFTSVTGGGTAGATSTTMAGATLSPYCAKFLSYAAAILIFFLPVGTMFVGGVVLQYALLYVKAIIGYLTVLVLISFLFILSPLFISFALFKATYKLFEKWVQYLITFALQMVIIFALLALCNLVLVPFGNFLNTTLGLVREYDGTWSRWFTAEPFHICSICQYNPITNPLVSYPSISSISSSSSSSSSNSAPPVTCVPEGPVPSGGEYVQGFGTDNQPISVIPLTHLLGHSDLILFIVSNVVALGLIASVLSELLKRAPELARQLGGGSFAASILGGAATSDIPGINYPGMDKLGSTLERSKNALVQNPFTRALIAAGAGFGVDRMLSGSRTQGPNAAPPTPPSSGSGPSTASANTPAPVVPAGDDGATSMAQKLTDLRNAANNTIQTVDRSIARSGLNTTLSSTEMQQIKDTVNSLRGQLQSAQTEESYDSILSQLQSIQRKLNG